ncbi:putative reverse transcriptase domain-containing protein [Tanacetum coccineum]
MHDRHAPALIPMGPDLGGRLLVGLSYFGTIPTAILATVPIVDIHLLVIDDHSLIPTETSTIAPVVPTLPHTSLFLYTDSSDSDTSKRPPLQDPYKVIVARWRSRVAARSSPPSSSSHDSPPTLCQILPAPPGLPRRPTILVLPGQLIPIGRPYRTHPNRVRKILTARNRVGPLPTHRLALRYPLNPSLPDHFTSDDSSLDSSSDSSSGYSSDTSSGALSLVCADLLPPRKRIRADINACIAASDTAAARETDVRVEVRIKTENEAEEEAESSTRGIIKTGMDMVIELVVVDDIAKPTREDFLDLVNVDGSREVMQIGLDMVMQELYGHIVEIPVQRIRQSAAMLERIETLERDNIRLRAITMSAATCTGMTPAAIEEIIKRRVEKALETYRNREPARENRDGHRDDNGNDNGNGNGDRGGNGNRNGLGGGNGNGQNVARAYNVGNSEKRGYAGPLPYCNNCKLHHEGQCTMKCGNCKRVGHLIRDCRATVATTTKGAPKPNQKVVTCYECGRQSHYRSDCLKLKNQNYRNKSGNKPNEARGRAYALGGGANPDSNVIMGTFLLNNHYACMLFDLGVDRSFVSTTFRVLLDIVPSTLDVSYVVELADGRIAKTNTLLRGCTFPFDIDLMHIELGGFDVIISMDWLSRYHAIIICDEKVVPIPYRNEVLEIQGDRCSSGITEKKAGDKSKEKRLEEVPTVQDFSKVFQRICLDFCQRDKLNFKLTWSLVLHL